MNSRERVLTALRHQEPDRVPLDSGGTSSSSISANAYTQLKRHLGITSGVVAIADPVQMLAAPEDWYYSRFQIDVLDPARDFCVNAQGWQDWQLPDGSPIKFPGWIPLENQNGDWVVPGQAGNILARLPAGGYFFDQTYFPLFDAPAEAYANPEPLIGKQMWGALQRPLLGTLSDPEFPKLLTQAARDAFENTDYAIAVNTGASLFELAQFLCRTDQFMMDLMAERKKIEALLDRLVEIHLKRLDYVLDAVGPYVHILRMSDDWGMQNGTLVSPQVFREVFKPRYKILYDFMRRKKPDAFLSLHSCGAIANLMPDFIELGLDIINPVQTGAAGMDAVRLKRDFGKDITFWGGGVDTQQILPWKSPQEVADDVKRRIDIFAPGGGFVFNSIHNISPEVPPENILAMFDAFAQHANYA